MESMDDLNLDTKNLDLYRKRFEDFKTFFASAKHQLSPERFEEFIKEADELLGVFLGIKPAWAGSLIDNFTDLQNLLPEYIKFNKLVYNTEAVKEIFRKYPEYFNFGFDNDLNDHEFWDNFYDEQDFELLNIRRGLIHGYPFSAVLNYAENGRLFSFIFSNQDNPSLTAEDQNLINYLKQGNHEAVFAAYQLEFRDLLKRLGKDISADQYAVLTTRSPGYVRGIGNFVWVGNPSKDDISYVVGIQNIYDALEIEDFIAQEFFSS